MKLCTCSARIEFPARAVLAKLFRGVELGLNIRERHQKISEFMKMQKEFVLSGNGIKEVRLNRPKCLETACHETICLIQLSS